MASIPAVANLTPNNGPPCAPYRTLHRASNDDLQLRGRYSSALADALTALVETGLEAYVCKLTTFLDYLSQSYDTSQRDVAAFQIVSLCLIGQYDAAREAVPSAFPAVMEENNLLEVLHPLAEVTGSLYLAPTIASKQTGRANDDRRQSAPVGLSRPPPTPVIRSREQAASGFSLPLTAIHSVDSAGIPQLRPSNRPQMASHERSPLPPRPQGTPPPPPLPPRPSAVSPREATPLNQLPHRPVSMVSYDPRHYAAPTPVQIAQTATKAVRRRPVQAAPSVSQSLPTPPYSPLPNGPQMHRQQFQRNQSLQYDQQMYFPPPPTTANQQLPAMPSPVSATPASRQPSMSRPSMQAQHLHPAEPRQQSHTRAQQPQRHAPDVCRPSPQQQQFLKPTGQAIIGQPGARTMQHGRSPLMGPARQTGFTGPPPAAKPKPSKMAKVKKFANTPAGKIAMRVGTGMVIASLTGGLVGAEAADLDFGGGEDVGASAEFGEGDFGGGEMGGETYAGEEVGSAEYGAFEDRQFMMEGGSGEYSGEYGTFEDSLVEGGGNEYGTFEDNMLLGAESEAYTGNYGTFEDQFVTDAGATDYGGEPVTFEDQYAADAGVGTEGGAGADTATSDLPGQVGPCFEDNVILSAAAG